MSHLVNDVVGGFNTMVKEQRAAPGTARLTLVQFDTKRETTFDNLPLTDIPELTTKQYVPGGGTALYDSLTAVASAALDRQLNSVEKPDKTILVIITDGDDTSSSECKIESVKALLERVQTDEKWDVMYLGANLDAFKGAEAINVKIAADGSNVRKWATNAGGVREMYLYASETMTRYRSK